MWLIDEIVERRIKEARERGEFDKLPGTGKPLQLDDDCLVPEDLRVAYRLLKNAGYLPEECRLRREISQLEALLPRLDEPSSRNRAVRNLRLLQARLGLRASISLLVEDGLYREKILKAMDDS